MLCGSVKRQENNSMKGLHPANKCYNHFRSNVFRLLFPAPSRTQRRNRNILREGNPEHGRELQAGYTVPRKTEAKEQKNENGKGEKP